MPRIQLLPPDVVNRIAAGEVIERPASVVKELVENAVDAGATEILVEVDEGGARRIRVRDNGCGIPREELSLAFCSHATSKLTTAGDGEESEAFDLFGIDTLGFRGEALASIASIAEVEILSRPRDAEFAHRLLLRGSQTPEGEPEPAQAPVGTSIEVRNLFFKTPARRKFLRSAATELSHITDQLQRLALGFPRVRFTLKSQGRDLLECPAVAADRAADGLRRRLEALIGEERARELLEVGSTEAAPGATAVHGFVGPPSVHRADARAQHFYVNGRWVRDRVMAHALQDAFRGFQIPGQKPVAYLFLEVPPDRVDINVHPTKSEVRFVDSSVVHRAVQTAVRSTLEKGEPPSLGLPARGDAATRPASGVGFGPATGGSRVRNATQDFFRSAPRAGACDSPALRFASAQPPGPQLPSPSALQETEIPLPIVPRPAWQILQSFILVEEEEGMTLWDQHALHEKVLYEEIIEALRSGSIVRQRLLLPEVVALPLEHVPLIAQVAERLAPLGFEVEPFGPREAAVHAVPRIFGDARAAAVVLEAAHAIASEPMGEGSSAIAWSDPLSERVRRVAQMVACKRAVKAGMPLDAEEIRSLLVRAQAAKDPRFCPHGRPASVFMSRGELERRFERK